MSILSRWRARHLLGAWVAYWLVLGAVMLRGPIAAVARALGAPRGQGSISAAMENGDVVLRVVAAGRTWTGATSFTALALWIAGPPLLLWLLWLVTRRAPAPVHESERDYRIT